MAIIQKRKTFIRGSICSWVRSKPLVVIVIVVGCTSAGIFLLRLRPSPAARDDASRPPFYCETHMMPDMAQHSVEMKDASDLQAKLRSSTGRCSGGTCRMTCGSSSGGDDEIAMPKLPEGMQLSVHQASAVWCALRSESERLGRPANLLVWGLGNDSPFWAKSTEGRVVFIEDNVEWFHKMKEKHKSLDQYLAKYETNIRRDLPRIGTSEFAIEIGNLLDPLLDPIGLTNESWDVILVDAPLGCSYGDPGRFGPIYTSKKLVDKQGHGYIFVDDYQRIAERRSSDVILDRDSDCKQESNCGQCVAIFDRIHPYTGEYIEKTAMFSFGASIIESSVSSMRKLDGAKPCKSISKNK